LAGESVYATEAEVTPKSSRIVAEKTTSEPPQVIEKLETVGGVPAMSVFTVTVMVLCGPLIERTVEWEPSPRPDASTLTGTVSCGDCPNETAPPTMVIAHPSPPEMA
jgi:hypothetical protein